jgi:hypothetical protein
VRQSGEAVAAKKKIDEEGRQTFKSLEEELLENKGMSYDFKMEVGFIDDRVAQHIKNHKTSFVVMSKNMSIRNKESFNEILEHLQTPLVIVP